MEWFKEVMLLSYDISLTCILLGGISVLGTLKFWQTGQSSIKHQKKGKLYFHSCFRSNRCIWLIREMNVLEDFEYIDVDVWDKSSKECKEYNAKVHPHASIPALELQDTTIIESGAICVYLAERYQQCLPHNMAIFYNIIFYTSATLDEVQEILFIQYHFKEPKGTENRQEIEHARQKFNICADYLTSCLQGKKYICGDEFSAADCVLGYNIWWASVIKDGFLLENYPELLSYLCRLKKRPAFKQTWNI